jgi:hypothetical protein
VYDVIDPSFCIIVQGRKELFLGNERYRYDPSHYLLLGRSAGGWPHPRSVEGATVPSPCASSSTPSSSRRS